MSLAFGSLFGITLKSCQEVSFLKCIVIIQINCSHIAYMITLREFAAAPTVKLLHLCEDKDFG